MTHRQQRAYRTMHVAGWLALVVALFFDPLFPCLVAVQCFVGAFVVWAMPQPQWSAITAGKDSELHIENTNMYFGTKGDR